MKWFKHFSDSLDDPFVQGLMDEFGHAGYVVYFGLLEIIAKENGNKLTGKIEIKPLYLQRKLRTSRTKLRQVLTFCSTSGKLLVNFHKETWVLESHKLLLLKDNYAKDLQVTCKKPSHYKEEEEEEEEEEETTTTRTHEAKNNGKVLPESEPVAVAVFSDLENKSQNDLGKLLNLLPVCFRQGETSKLVGEYCRKNGFEFVESNIKHFNQRKIPPAGMPNNPLQYFRQSLENDWGESVRLGNEILKIKEKSEVDVNDFREKQRKLNLNSKSRIENLNGEISKTIKTACVYFESLSESNQSEIKSEIKNNAILKYCKTFNEKLVAYFQSKKTNIHRKENAHISGVGEI